MACSVKGKPSKKNMKELPKGSDYRAPVSLDTELPGSVDNEPEATPYKAPKLTKQGVPRVRNDNLPPGVTDLNTYLLEQGLEPAAAAEVGCELVYVLKHESAASVVKKANGQLSVYRPQIIPCQVEKVGAAGGVIIALNNKGKQLKKQVRLCNLYKRRAA